MSLEGNFFLLQENEEDFHELRTATKIQSEINKGKYAPPGGHVSILKSGIGEKKGEKTVLFSGGTDFEQGKQYGFSSDLFGLKIESTAETFKIEQLNQVKSFSVTDSDQVRMVECSALFGTNGATLVDQNKEEDDEFDALMWGGQDAELVETQNRLVQIKGDKGFKLETTGKGKETKMSQIKATAFPSKTRELDIEIENFNPEEEIVQTNTPIGRTEHTMAKLSDEEMVMIGGITIPEPGPNICHPTDSTVWKLNTTTLTWIKCKDCEFTKRAGHVMHIHNGKIYIIGGYTYENNVPKKLHSINLLIEMELVADDIVPFVRLIDLVVPVDMPLQNIYGFAGAATNDNIYLFGGSIVSDYNDEEQDLCNFHTPNSNRSKLLPFSSVLYEIDIERESLLAIKAPKEFGTSNATMHVTDTDEKGKAERILVLGGKSKQIILYCKSEFEFDQCNLPGEFGGCTLEKMTPSTVTNTCTTCGKQIHEDCDMFKHKKSKVQNASSKLYYCPKCKGYGIKTIRPKVKSRRGGLI